jgi:hypothetical protein
LLDGQHAEGRLRVAAAPQAPGDATTHDDAARDNPYKRPIRPLAAANLVEQGLALVESHRKSFLDSMLS